MITTKRSSTGLGLWVLLSGHNKILQPSGRGIRSEKDKAAIILMDERITWDKYGRCLPIGFCGLKSVNPGDSIDKFFEHHFG